MSDYPLVPYSRRELEPVADPGPDWIYGRREAKEEEPIEGEFRELSDAEILQIYTDLPYEGEDVPIPPPEDFGSSGETKEGIRDRWKRWKEERGLRQDLKDKKRHEDLMIEVSRRGLEAKLEELKAKKREEKRKSRRAMGKVGKAVVKATVPSKPYPRFYIPKAMPEYYVPGGRVRKLTDPTGAPAGAMHTPHLFGLRRAGVPPPTEPIKTPMRDVERFEGLGTAMSRLRELERFPSVDKAVYAEIHANGDIDTPSHVRREVGQLGFSKGEIDTALKRLREAGLITASGRVHEGETELMIVGGK